MEQTDDVFDPALIVRVSRGDREKERRLLGDFLRLNDVDLAQLREAVRTRTHGEARNLAHRIRGAAQTLGAAALGRACRALEEAARAAPAGGLDAEWAELEQQAERLAQAVRRYLG